MTELQVLGWIVFSVYLLLIVVISFIAKKKTGGLVDYITAPRSYGPVVVGLALGATTCSAAATLGNPGLAYGFGWAGLWYPFGYGGIVFAWAIAAFKLSRMCLNVGAKSLPDFVGIRFKSQFVRVMAAIATILGVYYIAGQFAGGAWVFDQILGIEYSTGILIAAAVMIGYVVIGGTHAEMMNSAVQGAIMLLLATIVTIAVLVQVGTPGTINTLIEAQDPSLGWSNVFADPMFGTFTGPAIAIALSLFALSPQLTKMWFTIRSEKDIPWALIVGFIFMFMMGLLILFGGLGGRAVFPDIPPDTSVLMILMEYTPSLIVTIAGVGILAAIMSTTAGLFLVSGVAVANDIYKDVIAPKIHAHTDNAVLERRTAMVTRILIVVFAIIGLAIAVDPPPYLTGLMWVGIGALAAGISPLIIMGSVWQRTSKLAAEVGSVLGLGAHVFCYYVLGGMLGIEVFNIAWAGTGVGIILNFVALIVISLFTEPLPQEHLDQIFGECELPGEVEIDKTPTM